MPNTPTDNWDKLQIVGQLFGAIAIPVIILFMVACSRNEEPVQQGTNMKRQPHDPSETSRMCYRMAYFVLPQSIRDDKNGVLEILSDDGAIGAAAFYALACRRHGKEPRDELLQSFGIQTGELDESTRYYIISYPTPPDLESSPLTDEEMSKLMNNPAAMQEMMKRYVLAPYFSAVVIDQHTENVEYFVLGQSPDGDTTLRTVTPERNANLGEGSLPEIEAFITLLAQRLTDS